MVKNVLIILACLSILNAGLYFLLPRMQRYAAVFGRMFVGLVFMFSGFVKGIDPLGTAYRIEDYFIAYGMDWAMGYALSLSVLLCAVEFALGFFMFFNIRTKVFFWFVLLMMLGFTGVTFYDALYSPVPDCGCFGDALKLSNWETFYKNIVILIFLLPSLLYLKRFKSFINVKIEYTVSVLVFAGFISFSLYNYNHLPMIDFMEWKVGNVMYEKNPKPTKYYVTYQNKKTKQKQEYLLDSLPYSDTTWVNEWEYVDRRIVDPNKTTMLSITDENGADKFSVFVKNPDYQFIAVASDYKQANMDGMKKLNVLFDSLYSEGTSMIMLANGDFPEFYKYRTVNKLNESLAFYNSDDTQLKMMVRSNPGLILLKDGVVIAKWHYNDFPTYQEFKDLKEKLDKK